MRSILIQMNMPTSGGCHNIDTDFVSTGPLSEVQGREHHAFVQALIDEIPLRPGDPAEGEQYPVVARSDCAVLEARWIVKSLQSLQVAAAERERR